MYGHGVEEGLRPHGSLMFSHLIYLVWFCLDCLDLVCFLYYMLPRRLSCSRILVIFLSIE